MILVYLIVIITILSCLRVLFLGFLGSQEMEKERMRDTLMECRNARLVDAYNEVGISLIVSDLNSREDLTPFLSLDLINYEVVLLMDFEENPLAEIIQEEFSMFKTSKCPSREISCVASRGVYRSRNNNYSRLILVDLHHGSNSQRFNLGANIAHYEYVMAVDGCCKIEPCALCAVVRALLERIADTTIYAVAGFRLSGLQLSSLDAISLSERVMVLGAGMRSVKAWGEEVSVVFNREYLVQAGGYGVDYGYDYELFKRMQRMNVRGHDAAENVMLSRVFLLDGRCDKPVVKRAVFSRGYSLMLLICLVVMLCVARHYEIMCLALILIYFCSIAVGAMGLFASRGCLKFKKSWKMVFALLFHPFFLIFRLIVPTRF